MAEDARCASRGEGRSHILAADCTHVYDCELRTTARASCPRMCGVCTEDKSALQPLAPTEDRYVLAAHARDPGMKQFLGG